MEVVQEGGKQAVRCWVRALLLRAVVVGEGTAACGLVAALKAGAQSTAI